ncbi:MAG: hypothetical protein Kow0099_04450 [Candidatus Abyssubacteria bacterium]
MAEQRLNIVTGAFGYTGKYITRRLLARGARVRTLTWHPQKNEFSGQVEAVPFDFTRPDKLRDKLKGADVFFNTYWIRFPRGKKTFEKAVEHTKVLIDAARQAGVGRFVHISITNPSEDSSLPYFRGKAQVEKAIIESGLSYAIIRPAIIFGREDILINNIAWLLRRLPVFGVIGSGEYRLRPIYVEDLAKLCIEAAHKDRNMVMDAVGPETYTFNELVRLLARTVGSRARILYVPPWPGYLSAKLLGLLVKDVLLTRDEIEGLTANLLVTKSPSTGETRLSEWLKENADTVGVRYASELKRHYRSV